MFYIYFLKIRIKVETNAMILLNMTKPLVGGHLFIHLTDSFKRLINSELTVLMNGPLNHWLTRFVQKGGFIQNWLSLWMGHWIIDSLDSFKKVDSFRIDFPYEWATESLSHSIRSKRWIHSELTFLMNGPLNHWLTRFVQKGGFIQNWLSLWMGHWIIDSLDSFKKVDSFSNETPLCVVLRHTTVLLWLWSQLFSSAKFSKNSQYFV